MRVEFGIGNWDRMAIRDEGVVLGIGDWGKSRVEENAEGVSTKQLND